MTFLIARATGNDWWWHTRNEGVTGRISCMGVGNSCYFVGSLVIDGIKEEWMVGICNF